MTMDISRTLIFSPFTITNGDVLKNVMYSIVPTLLLCSKLLNDFRIFSTD